MRRLGCGPLNNRDRGVTDFKNPEGAPGIAPRWTSSAKSGVGTAATAESRVWFTISHGILNEIYAPRLDTACIRDFGFMVTGDGYFSEEKRDTDSFIEMVEDGVPAFRLVNSSNDGRYRISKTVFSDPVREVVFQDVHFEALVGNLSDYNLHALVSPHLVNAGANNTAWYDDFKGRQMLFAKGRLQAFAVASSVPWLARSAGYVGFSDGWQTLSRGEGVRTEFRCAEEGNVALTGTVDLLANEGRFALAIGFGVLPEEAAIRALLGLQQPLDRALERYCVGWREWQRKLLPLDQPDDAAGLNRFRVSTAVLASHRDEPSGAMIASLSIPWGFSKGDDDLGGYHLIWPRDLVETAVGLLAAGTKVEAKAVLDYLVATQEADGHWSQNSWLDGRPYWRGVQMDETAFPIVLYDMLVREDAIEPSERQRYNAMIASAASFIVRNGPATPQDRWEEDGGYSPFTLAVEISALLAAAEAMDLMGLDMAAKYLRQTADFWNEQIDVWTYAVDTELSRSLGIDGYYMRIGFDGGPNCYSRGPIPIRNREDGNTVLEANRLISPDALALVRFGLRAADDPRIVNTVKAIDMLLKRELPSGSYWYRYNDDGYGEHADGTPFNGSGIGRLWPLLTGERAHYEIAAGRYDEARRLLTALEDSASSGGLLPEQIWDSADIPERELYLGRPSGSAMPLVWAHAEHIKLLRSLRDGAVFDMPRHTHERHVKGSPPPAPIVWRPTSMIGWIVKDRVLRLDLPEPALIHWSVDDWATVQDDHAEATGLQTFIYDIATEPFAPGTVIRFTFYWPLRNTWEGANYQVAIS
ncbi:MAG: glucan 1,4-alpha-glucosidase [Xanthobacteraceae bacterium]|nr:glucan 1,4-alpha-glucosidase [Xanthobacteraceae bacterium]